MKTFMDKCLSGESSPEEIDDHIEEWHTGNSNKELHEYLGMTRGEYVLWFDRIMDLKKIIDIRERKK